jgi:hypothetical protein
MYGFRRQKAAPVPDAYGNYEGFGAESMMAPTRTYGSMSPKYDWATPRYIRAEPSGMGDFAGDGCLGDVRDKVVDSIFSVAGIYDITVPFVGSLRGWLKDRLASLQNYAVNTATGDEQKKAELKQAIVNAIMQLPDVPDWLQKMGVSTTWKGSLATSIADAAVNAIASCTVAPATSKLKQWCDQGYALDDNGNPFPPESPNSPTNLPDNCAMWGYQYNGPAQQFVEQPGFQYRIMERLPTNLAKQQQMLIGTQPRMSLMQIAGQAAAACANNGGVMLPYDDGKTYCQPSDATMAACDAAGGTPSWDPDNGYKCPPIVPAPIVPGGSGMPDMPGVPGVPGVPAAGGSSMMLLAGAAILAFVLLK